MGKTEITTGGFSIRTPPSYCQYAGGHCDQNFSKNYESRGVFLYPAKPATVALTIEEAVKILKEKLPAKKWYSWKDFRPTGQMIFCEICKRIRHSDYVVADVTTLNFNLLFEIGFAIGLGIPVSPIRDTTIITNKTEFDELGMLDTIGYVDFQNSQQLYIRHRDVSDRNQPKMFVQLFEAHSSSKGRTCFVASISGLQPHTGQLHERDVPIFGWGDNPANQTTKISQSSFCKLPVSRL